MSVIDKILKVWYYIFGLLIAIILIYVGMIRISMGINFIRISDPFTAHFMNVGLLYLQIGMFLLVGLAIILTYTLTRHKVRK